MRKHTVIALLFTHCAAAIVAVVLWTSNASLIRRWTVPPFPIPRTTLPREAASEPRPEWLVATTNDNLESVIGALERGEVYEAYVINAIGIESIVRATPEACVKFAPNKMQYDLTPKRSARLVSLLRELRADSKPLPDEPGADVRVGLILRGGRSGGWRWTVFTDEFGKYGYLGGHGVATSPALVRFVNRAFANLE